MIQLKRFTVYDYLHKSNLCALKQLEECYDPLRGLFAEPVTRMLLSCHRKGLETRMRRISLRLNPHNSKAQGPKTELVSKEKSPHVVKKTLTVDVVGGLHRLTVSRELHTSTDAASLMVKSCESKPIPMDFISQGDGKPLCDREVL